jgi:hypothetical protein
MNAAAIEMPTVDVRSIQVIAIPAADFAQLAKWQIE